MDPQRFPRRFALLVCLAGAALIAGCESAKEREAQRATANREAEDGEPGGPGEPAANRASPMLQKLRDSNRQAVRADQQEDVESMRRELAKVEVELAQAGAGTEAALALETRRNQLRLTIEQQERMVKGLGE